jgi:CheY-like chemotaxis protein
MPQMKGTAVAEAIWRLRQEIPILLITGFNNTAELESYRAMGLRGPLRKPFLAEALVEAVAECFPAEP